MNDLQGTLGLGFLQIPPRLQDKWRNLSVSNGAQGSKEKSRVPKPKAFSAPPATTATTATPQNASPAPQSASSDAAVAPDASQNDQDAKNPPRYASNTVYVLCPLYIHSN